MRKNVISKTYFRLMGENEKLIKSVVTTHAANGYRIGMELGHNTKWLNEKYM